MLNEEKKQNPQDSGQTKISPGYLHVYTGNGKGKTSAAIGIAVRGAGAGLKTAFIQFMKEYPYSEVKSLSHLNEFILVEQFGGDKFVYEKRLPDNTEKAGIKKGLTRAEELISSGLYDIIILDEIFVSVYFGAITKEELISFTDKHKGKTELIYTGRYAPEEITDRADIVTEMKEVKHYYQQGILSRKGIDS